MTIDFTALKGTAVGTAPSKKYRTRGANAVNPVQAQYDQAVKAIGSAKEWITVTLPGATEFKQSATTGRDSTSYGKAVTEFANHLRRASRHDKSGNRTVHFRYEDLGDGRVNVFFRIAELQKRAS